MAGDFSYSLSSESEGNDGRETSIQEQAQIMNFSYRDAKKLVSRIWNEEDLLDKKRRWLISTSTLPTIDGRHRKSKRPKFLTDMCLTESLVRNDELCGKSKEVDEAAKFLIVDHKHLASTCC